MGRFVVDLHMHTSRYSPCAPLLEPEMLISRLHERGLSGGVITEHDMLWSEDELQELIHSSSEGVEGVRLYRGVEISADHAHILAFGLESLAETPRGCPIQRVIDVAREQGAALIWAHPYLVYRNMLSPEHFPDIRLGIHGLEVSSSMTKGDDSKRAKSLAQERGWHMTGGSDAHAPENVGIAATEFPFLPQDEKALAQAIIAGQCRPKVLSTKSSTPRKKCSS